MLKCVECGYEGREFNLAIDGLSKGAFTYLAKCPICDSRKIKHVNGYFERDLLISVREKRTNVQNEVGPIFKVVAAFRTLTRLITPKIGSWFIIGLSAAFLWHFANIWFYGQYLIREPNLIVLSLETVGLLLILSFGVNGAINDLRGKRS